MPDEYELQSATNLAVTLAWVAGAVVAAYLLGVVMSWALLRVGRRSELICDVAELTRMPLRAALGGFRIVDRRAAHVGASRQLAGPGWTTRC